MIPHEIMSKDKLMFKIAFAVCAALSLIGCSAPDHISVSGSTTILPTVSKAAEAYKMQTGQTVFVNAGGSGAGFNQLAEGQTDIGMMSRDITADELKTFPEIDFRVIAIGTDAVVPVVSSEIYNAGVKALSLSEIGSIYMGEIDNWKAFGGPDKDILVIDKEASSGTRHTFMDIVMGDKNALAAGADLVLGANNEEQTAITQSDSAIGMLSHAWINDDVIGLSIKTEEGLIDPTLDNIQSGMFPITRDLTLITRSNIKPEAKAFVDYILSPEGQSFVAKSGYVKVIK